MPSVRTQLKRFVVAILVLFDEALQADVAADFKSQVITLEQEQQSRDAAIAVAERVDAEKIEVERAQRDERMYRPVCQDVAPPLNQFPHRGLGLRGADGTEPDVPPAAGA